MATSRQLPKISAIFVTAIMLGSLLKITSNLRAVGGLINAIMISCYNTAMGSLLQEIFRRLRLRNAMGEVAFSDVCQAGSGSGCRASWGRILVLVWHVSRFCWSSYEALEGCRFSWSDLKDWRWLRTKSLKTPQKFNIEFTPEKWWEVGRRSSFLLGLGNFSLANCETFGMVCFMASQTYP